LAVLVPSALWGLWFAIFLRSVGPGDAVVRAEDGGLVDLRPDFGQTVDLVWDGILNTFNHMVLDNRFAGAALAVAFVGHLVWRLTQGHRATEDELREEDGRRFPGPARVIRRVRARTAPAAMAIAWTAALLFDWVGLTRARALLLFVEEYRYQIVAGGFALLALVPPEKVRWPRNLSMVGAAAVATATIVIGAAVGTTFTEDLRQWEHQQGARGAYARVLVAVADLDEARVPDDYHYSQLLLGFLEARRLRRVTDTFGGVEPDSPEAVDRMIVDELRWAPKATVFPSTPDCPAARPVVEVPAKPQGRAFVSASGDEPVTVALRRFGTEWVEVGEIDPGKTYRLDLADFASPVPWEIRGDGLCRVGVG
jgi:hypothetical protein